MKDFGFCLAHIGINTESSTKALALAQSLQSLFGFRYKEGNQSVFSADKKIEIMKSMFRGTNGHIAIGTTDIEGAVTYLEETGVVFDESSAVVREGKLKAIYLNKEFEGFAIHLVQI